MRTLGLGSRVEGLSEKLEASAGAGTGPHTSEIGKPNIDSSKNKTCFIIKNLVVFNQVFNSKRV